MTEKSTFAVYTIGITDSEKQALRNIFRLSLYRARSYALHESLLDGPAQILLVDPQGSDNAADSWTEFRNRYPQIPIVVVYRESVTETHPYCVRRPFVASRILATLDKISIQEHSQASQLVIGANAAVDHSTTAANPVAPTQTDSSPRQTSDHTHLALVVDDSMPVRKQIELELKLLGVSADFAESGEQAFKLLESKPYDIIFLDVMLPGVDGYRVCKTIKKNGTTKQTPVVMLTGKSSPFDRVRGTFAGCDTYLTKPVAHESFQKVVRKYLG